MIVRKLTAAAVVTMALGLPVGVVHAAEEPDVDAVPDAPVASSFDDTTGEADGAAVWVGVVTGVSGLAGLAFSVRRPRLSHA
jgi:hypothetical protein